MKLEGTKWEEKFQVKRNSGQGTWTVSLRMSNKQNDIECDIYDNGSIVYGISGCYDSGQDFIPFKLEELKEIQECVDFLTGGKDEL